MSSGRAAVYAACASLAAIAQANAQNEAPPVQQPPVDLPPITVTAGRGSDLEKLDVSTTVLTRKQVEAMPETGIDQIVNRIPGVFTFTIPTGQLHPTGQPVSIRGFGTSTTINTLVMVDGVPINDPYFQTVDWSRISKNSIERVEVIRGGGATTLWGNMATGGVINIVTRQPTATGVQADLSYGSYNTTNAGVGGTMIVNDKLNVGLAYNHAQSSGYHLPPSQYQNANLVPTA
jgi:outer membrane cobalamin receptor